MSRSGWWMVSLAGALSVVLSGCPEPEPDCGTDAELCASTGATCGEITATDRCGQSRTVTCGTCSSPETCGGGGTANVCGCTETDVAFCSRLGKNCETVTGTDLCGRSRTVSCGTCAAPQTCGGGGTQNVCGCAAETNSTFCTRQGATCGELTAADNCGQSRTVTCGSCTLPQTCGGGGTPNFCGCTPHTDAVLCTSQGKNCGPLTATDNCGQNRTVTCGSCTLPQTCGGGGTAGVCGCTPESDFTFCSRQFASCGSLTAADNCGVQRTVTCGSCTLPQTCGGSGTAYRCGCTPESDTALCARAGYSCGELAERDNCGQMRVIASCGTCTSGACGGAGTPGACGSASGCGNGAWSAAGSMVVGRMHPAVVPLADGRVLAAGGWSGQATRTSETFDATTNQWTAQGTIPAGPTAADPSSAFYSYPAGGRLGDGRVLAVGYADGVYSLFNPADGQWTSAGNIRERLQPLAFTLPSGKALVSHGVSEGGYFVYGTETLSADGTTWGDFSSVAFTRRRPNGVVLADGSVLVTGGDDSGFFDAAAISGAEIFDSTRARWLFTDGPQRLRTAAAMARLNDGRVLLIGGQDARAVIGPNPTRTALVEVYDPATGRWSNAAPLNVARAGHSATTLSDGRVLVVGGVRQDSKPVPWAEVYSPATNTWTMVAPLSTARAQHLAEALPDGRVMVAGGFDPQSLVVGTTEVATPANFCADTACVPETDESLCIAAGAGCGLRQVTDRCGNARTAFCGNCLVGTCGGAGTPNRCGIAQRSGWTIEPVARGGGIPTILVDGTSVSVVFLSGGTSLAERDARGWRTFPVHRAGGYGVRAVKEPGGRITFTPVQGIFSQEPPLAVFSRGGRWVDEDASRFGSWAADGDLVYAPDGTLHLCWRSIYNSFQSLDCGVRAPGLSWGYDFVTGAVSRDFEDIAVALDGSGRLTIAFVNSSRRLSLATRTTSGWTIEVVDAATDAAGRLALAYAPDGTAYIAYHDYAAQSLKYAMRAGSGWATSTVAVTADVYNAPDIAIGSDGYPRISFYDQNADALKLATWTGSAWSFSTVDVGTRTVTHSSIAQGPDGRWHVAYSAYDSLGWILYAVSN